MEELLKTRQGKKFMEYDIPRLTEAMEKLAEVLLQHNKIEEKKLVLEQKRYLTEKNAGITRSCTDSNIAE
jgi:hypothetical protein